LTSFFTDYKLPLPLLGAIVAMVMIIYQVSCFYAPLVEDPLDMLTRSILWVGHSNPQMSDALGSWPDYEPYFPPDSLLPLTSNYLATQPLTWPFLTALADPRRLEETTTCGNQLERRIWLIFAHSSIVTMAMGNKYTYYCPLPW
jgi:hypothetical protein